MASRVLIVSLAVLLGSSAFPVQAQDDFAPQLQAMVQAPSCSQGCTVTIPAGTHRLGSDVTVKAPGVHLIGNRAILETTGAKLVLQGDGDSIEGTEFDLGGEYRHLCGVWIKGGSNILVRGNRFTGSAPYAIYVNYAGPGLRIENNTFTTDAAGKGPGPMTIDFTSDFAVTGNHFQNTHGFGIPMVASKNGTVSGNEFSQPLFRAPASGASAGSHLASTLPSYVTRVAAYVDGKPAPSDAGANAGGNDWSINLTRAAAAEGRMELVGWQALENIQANSYSSHIVIRGNTMDGTGDTGIDVVSDYHANLLSTQRAAGGQRSYRFNGKVTWFAAVTMNGHMLTGAELADGGPAQQADGSWLVTLRQPATPGAVLSLVDLYIGKNEAADYPQDVLIEKNTIRNARGSGIAIEIPAQDVRIEQNTLEDCGKGVTDVSYSSGIFIAGPVRIEVAGNSIVNHQRTMRMGISLIGFYGDNGHPVKDAVFSNNQFGGSFEHRYFIPAPDPRRRQAGIAIEEATRLYPADPNFALFRPESESRDAHYGYIAHQTRVALHPEVRGGVPHSVEFTIAGGNGSTAELRLLHPELLKDVLLRVTFRAFALNGASRFFVRSVAGGVAAESSIPITLNAWQDYSVNFSTMGVDLSQPLVLGVASTDATGSHLLIADLHVAATPLD